MKSSAQKSEQKNKEIDPNEEISEASEENSENPDQEDDPALNVNYASFITTPYERVLAIINEAKTFILSITKEQQELVKGLEWAIKVISSHSLYSYEIKDQDYLTQQSEDNPDFKQFIEFVNSYNDEVIQMNKKINVIGGKASLNSKRLNVPSNSINKVEEKKTEEKEQQKEKEKEKKSVVNNEINNNNKVKLKSGKTNIIDRFKSPKSKNIIALRNKNKSLQRFEKTNTNKFKPIKIANNKKTYNNKSNIQTKKETKEFKPLEFPQSALPKKKGTFKYNSRLSSDNRIIKNLTGKIGFLTKDKMNIDDNALHKSFSKDSPKLLNEINYPTNRILEKTFNIFELKEIVGYSKVLPIMGKVILDAFGLVSDEIISTKKLEPFLVSISNQYIESTLYHNSMHGADVTHSLCLYFLNSNAEETCQSLVLDILGILIAALGHDLGHPGFTNPFHINSSSELALTYNDASCLENFHASKLFRTIRKPETDIFEKLSVPDYKTIRKRMIGNILATDMSNHGKIMTVIKTRLSISSLENKQKFELLTGNENTKFEEQQSLFDFMIHAADLAHNTKLFNISLKWVELLSEEFWLQGDTEKNMKLPVSFLCDRENYNIPKSQIGFIKGFIIPTFDCLVNAFPTLKYTLDNAKTNLNRWQRLANKGRLKGWTPEKTKQVNYKKKMKLYNAISVFSEEKNTKIYKRRSGNVNSLSHELQVKKNENDNKEQTEKASKDKNNIKTKIIRPNIINKSKNHDKKIHINKFPKKK